MKDADKRAPEVTQSRILKVSWTRQEVLIDVCKLSTQSPTQGAIFSATAPEIKGGFR
jgi:hypothetical protein